MTNVDLLLEIDATIEVARKNKASYLESVARLVEIRKELKSFRADFTVDAQKRSPQLLQQWNAAYEKGERLKDEMYSQGTWPKDTDPKLTTYSDILRSVPEYRRSPQLLRCLSAWEEWAECKRQWETMFPPPRHFYWNGPRLEGPNYYPDFDIPYEAGE